MNQGYARLDEVFEPIGSRTESPESNDTYIIGRSRSQSSPISVLDTDDYDSERDTVMTHDSRSPSRIPEHLNRRSVSPSPSPSVASSAPPPPPEQNREVMKHILKIHRDIQKIMKEDPDEESSDFPILQMGLFFSVGLFVLLAMNMMLQMGKQHVTYRFNSVD